MCIYGIRAPNQIRKTIEEEALNKDMSSPKLIKVPSQNINMPQILQLFKRVTQTIVREAFQAYQPMRMIFVPTSERQS